jgi:addiction module RelE/StbE family toxin
MAQIIWTEPALSDLDAIADYIAIENRDAAQRLVHKVFEHVSQLAEHPESGSRLGEMKRSRYRQLVEPHCRIIYRYADDHVFILHVMRTEQLLRNTLRDEQQ